MSRTSRVDSPRVTSPRFSGRSTLRIATVPNEDKNARISFFNLQPSVDQFNTEWVYNFDPICNTTSRCESLAVSSTGRRTTCGSQGGRTGRSQNCLTSSMKNYCINGAWLPGPPPPPHAMVSPPPPLWLTLVWVPPSPPSMAIAGWVPGC